MHWEFTPQDVVTGKVGYSLESFRSDLLEEIRLNLPGLDSEMHKRIHALVYDLLYWLATGKDFDEFLAQFESSGFTQLFLGNIREHSEGNAEMLGAILQRLIMDRVEHGMPLERSLAEVGRLHAAVASAGIGGANA
ncbi:MAG: hypothetical protein ACM3SO_17350 [Betaproteobacteria bacterium]